MSTEKKLLQDLEKSFSDLEKKYPATSTYLEEICGEVTSSKCYDIRLFLPSDSDKSARCGICILLTRTVLVASDIAIREMNSLNSNNAIERIASVMKSFTRLSTNVGFAKPLLLSLAGTFFSISEEMKKCLGSEAYAHTDLGKGFTVNDRTGPFPMLFFPGPRK